MSIDISQFVQTFFDESFEGLDIMESGLLNLNDGEVDSEVINSIFRAAHSIKGGSATFGFSEVSTFTHGMETLLDEMRDGRRKIDAKELEVLLESVDCLREMLAAVKDKTPVDVERTTELKNNIEQILQGGGSASTSQEAEVVAPVDTGSGTGWQIYFRPKPQMMQCGNDPVRMLRELDSLGAMDVSVDISALPAFSDLTPEESYLAWNIVLKGDVSREVINEVFSWVEDDCELDIEPLVAEKTTQPVNGNAEAVQGELVDERRKDDRRSTSRRSGNFSMGEGSSIRVGIDKVDAVINLVGELVTTQSMLSTLGDGFDMSRIDKMAEALDQLERNTRELQENIMRIRMLPISFVFNRFPRLVHDLSLKLGKEIELVMLGEQTELDKTVIEKIGDPLVHLVRNSLDHGIELPAVRVAAGKTAKGKVTLNAYHKGGSIMIEVMDDGKGIDREALLAKALERELVSAEDAENFTDEQVYNLIFLPGFSMAAEVSDVSGRGVGMDVVRRNIQGLGGTINVGSKLGCGTSITIRLPLTLAILEGQLISVGEETYIIPLVSIIESLQVTEGMINEVAGQGEVCRFRDGFIPVIGLYKQFTVADAKTDLLSGLIVVVEAEGRKVGLFVDDLLGQQQVAIKSLETNYQRVEGVSGATIMGDGRVALILDIPGLIRMRNLH